MTNPNSNPPRALAANQRAAQILRGWAVALALLLPSFAMAVVCPFNRYMPKGEQLAGHAVQWYPAADGEPARMIQWWYPASGQKDAAAGTHVYSDYRRELLQTAVLPDGGDPAVTKRMHELAKAAESSGTVGIRFSHMMAATMRALRDATPAPGQWPVIWLAGDPSFADELATYGFIVVSSPPVYGTAPTFEQRTQAALLALDETRQRFGLRDRKAGFAGFGENAVLAARVSGLQPSSSGLVMIGEWKPLDDKLSRHPDPRWFDPAEVRTPTLYAIAGDVYTPGLGQPLRSPFSDTTVMQLLGIDSAHLELGMQEACAPRLVVGRLIPPLVLVQTQHALRTRIAHFFADQAKIEIHTRPLTLLPLDERRKPPIDLHEDQVAAPATPPPSPEQIAALLDTDGVTGLLADLPTETRKRAPAIWWEMALAQMQIGSAAKQTQTLLDAWVQSQPQSAAAAVHLAAAAQAAAVSPDQVRANWKNARALLKKDVRMSPAQRQHLDEIIEAGLSRRD